ncbi:FASTKD3 [Branchiostoma lanceolatum]|uniref:FASTKD3 protein n=1 Tax=Branchiostoma lanceolatum TaxID=7740 RepID=A0A8J9YU87_BRALA|nr:FASTKD3 [Branchiostoma lanceolatum]
MASRLLTCVTCGTRLSHNSPKSLQHLCQASSVITKSRAQFKRDTTTLDATTIPSVALSTGGKRSSKITVVLLPDIRVSEETVVKNKGDRLYLKHKFESCSTVKQVQKLLQNADLKSGLSLEATVIALYTITKLQMQKSPQDTTLLHQDFFKGLCRKIVNNTGHLSTPALILSLESANMFNMSAADYLQSALIAECTLRVTRGEFDISELFQVGKFLGHIQQDLPILEEIAEDVAEKWEEVGDKNIAGLYGFLEALPHVPNELRSKLVQKTMSVTPRLSPHDLSAVAKSLTRLQGNVNSLSVFLRLARFAYKYMPRYTDAELCDVLDSYIHFGHHDWSLTKALEQCVPKRVFTMHPSAVSKVMDYFSAKRVLSKPISDAVAESFVYNAESFSPEEIASQIVPYGQLNYLPPNAYRFLEKVEELLMARFHLFPLEMMVNMLYSFACVGRVPLNFVNRVCSPYAEMQLEGVSGTMDKEIHKKLTQLMLAVELECPQFQTQRLMKKFSQPLDPQLPTPRFFEHPTMYILQQSLTNVLGGRQYLRHNVMLPSGYIADFEVQLDKEGHVLSYNNGYLNETEEAVDKRIVVCVLFPHHFCMDTHHLLGRQVMKMRHLKLLGYQVVQVPYFEFGVLKTDQTRGKYIHQKLFPTTYKFSW